MFKFEKLDVWEKAIKFADVMIEIADSLPKTYQFSFSDQLRRAGLSVPNNIAEGAGRRGVKESSNFFNISKGSVYECISILVILSMRELISWSKFNKREIYNLADEICRMLSGLIRK
ncbi:MAG TPA: four helix bundle protein [Patescibacteria group bacterium]|nr:four helix bundle protein [Patescibacteria group bacterium]